MKVLKYIFLLLITWGCSNETTTDNTIDPLNYHQELNVSYGNDGHQKMDIYLPANRTSSTKTLILIHGGGWHSGDKTDMNSIKDLIRQDLPDLAVVNINYRLADANNRPYPMQIEDISSVIDYLKNNKLKYSISEDFGFIGISAGGHLSLLWSYGFDVDKNVKMVCSIVGPTNLTDPNYLNDPNPDIQNLLKLFHPSPDNSFLEEISPLHQVTDSAPPTILFYGGQDPLVPVTQGTDLQNKLLDLEVVNEFTLYPTAGHGWTGLELFDTWTKLKTFTQIHL